MGNLAQERRLLGRNRALVRPLKISERPRGSKEQRHHRRPLAEREVASSPLAPREVYDEGSLHLSRSERTTIGVAAPRRDGHLPRPVLWWGH